MPEEYINSDKCTKLISTTLKNVTDNKLKVYIHLLEFKKVIKTVQKLKRKSVKLNVRNFGELWLILTNSNQTEVEEKRRKLDLELETRVYPDVEKIFNNLIPITDFPLTDNIAEISHGIFLNVV